MRQFLPFILRPIEAMLKTCYDLQRKAELQIVQNISNCMLRHTLPHNKFVADCDKSERAFNGKLVSNNQ